MLDFHKAKPIKRLAAYVIDLILLVAITAGVWYAIYSATDYNACDKEFQSYIDQYAQKHGVDLNIPSNEIQNYPEEVQKKYNEALLDLNDDKQAMSVYAQKAKINLLAAMVGLFAAYVILEVMIPLIFKNGQTVGKKIMGLCVMHKYHVRVGFMQIIYRSILGKYFIETLIPVEMLILKNYGVLGTTASLIMAIIAMTQGFIVLMSQANCGIHDKLFNTVVADFKKQHIFDNWDERFDFEEAYEKEMAEREAKYGG